MTCASILQGLSILAVRCIRGSVRRRGGPRRPPGLSALRPQPQPSTERKRAGYRRSTSNTPAGEKSSLWPRSSVAATSTTKVLELATGLKPRLSVSVTVGAVGPAPLTLLSFRYKVASRVSRTLSLTGSMASAAPPPTLERITVPARARGQFAGRQRSASRTCGWRHARLLRRRAILRGKFVSSIPLIRCSVDGLPVRMSPGLRREPS